MDLNELTGVDLSVMRRGGGRRGSAFRVSRARGEARRREAVVGGRASVEEVSWGGGVEVVLVVWKLAQKERRWRRTVLVILFANPVGVSN